MNTTSVVNLRREAFDVYIGRAGHGQDGYFGNPIPVDFKRVKDPAYAAEMLGRYRAHFLERVERDPAFRARVLELRGKVLGCFCKDARGQGPCHGDIIAAWVDGRPLDASAPTASAPEASPEPDTGLALTLHQPWASAIVSGPKRIENRIWAPPSGVIGRRIWIHAGLSYATDRHAEVLDLWPALDELVLPTGAIIGSAVVTGYVHDQPDGGVRVVGAGTHEMFDDPWWIGPCGWLLGDVRALPEPVPCRGAQKLWRIPADALARCRAQHAPSTDAGPVQAQGGAS